MFKNINSAEDIQSLNLDKLSSEPPFSNTTQSFLEEFSNNLLKNKNLRKFPEIIALGFWLRKSNLKRLYENFYKESFNYIALPRGLVFHISPANVDTMFIYSWVLSLLMGNSNLVRVPSSENEQTLVLQDELLLLLNKNKYCHISSNNIFINYGHDDEINRKLSSICDVRVVWGGKNTVNAFRKYPLKDTATEVNFTNKFSLSIINSDAIYKDFNTDNIANSFFNDAYFMEQRACSSPKLIVWTGNNSDLNNIRNRFWNSMKKVVYQKNPPIDVSMIMNKFTDLSILTMLRKAVPQDLGNNLINVVEISELDELTKELNGGGGLFFEMVVSDIDTFLCNIDRSIQSASVFGYTFDDIKSIIIANNLKGIDRFIQLGDASNFDFVWDGFNLMNEFSRLISVGLPKKLN